LIGPVLGAFGLALVVIEDLEALGRISNQLVPRLRTKKHS